MDLFETFLQEKKFLNGVTPKTISTYQCAYKAYQRVAVNGLQQPDVKIIFHAAVGET